MVFLVELLLWLVLPVLFAILAGLPSYLRKAVQGLWYPALNQQISRLQFITRLTLLGLPVAFMATVVLGAWFREWRLGCFGLLAMAGAAYWAAWCGGRIEQMVKHLQLHKQQSIEME